MGAEPTALAKRYSLGRKPEPTESVMQKGGEEALGRKVRLIVNWFTSENTNCDMFTEDCHNIFQKISQ